MPFPPFPPFGKQKASMGCWQLRNCLQYRFPKRSTPGKKVKIPLACLAGLSDVLPLLLKPPSLLWLDFCTGLRVWCQMQPKNYLKKNRGNKWREFAYHNTWGKGLLLSFPQLNPCNKYLFWPASPQREFVLARGHAVFLWNILWNFNNWESIIWMTLTWKHFRQLRVG